MLQVGKKAPAFKLQDQSGEVKTLADLAGPKGLVLYAYPKDSTSGCTAEAREFQEKLGEIRNKGFGVAGLSKDSVQSHQNFAAKNGLEFSLLSDPETQVLQAIGAWGEKKNRGRVSMGTIRSTYVLDVKGKVKKVYSKVKAKGHAEQVALDLEALEP